MIEIRKRTELLSDLHAMSIRLPNLIILLILFFAAGNLEAGEKTRKLTLSRDTILSEKGQRVAYLHMISDRNFYAIHPSKCGRYTFLVLRKYIKSIQNWASSGEIVCYDHHSDSIRWKLNTEAFKLNTYDNKLLIQDSKTSKCYQASSGELLWEKKDSHVVFVDDKYNFGITENGTLIDLISGLEPFPEQELQLNEGINEVITLESGKSLISAGGLMLISPELKIEGFSKETTSYVSGKRILGNATSLLVGVGVIGLSNSAAYGPLFLETASMDSRVSGLTSNVLNMGDHYYQAYAEKLVCYDTSLKAQWSTSLGKHRSGASMLSIYGDSLVLVNKGIGYLGGSPYRVCEPGLFIFDRHTGRMTDSLGLEISGSGLIQVVHQGNHLLFLTEKEELTYSLPERRITKRVQITPSPVGTVSGYLNPEGIYQCPKGFSTCEGLDSRPAGTRYVAGLGPSIALLKESSNEAKFLVSADLCNTGFTRGEYTVLKCAGGLTIIDSAGRITDTCQLIGEGKLNGQYLFLRSKDRKSINIVDMMPLCDSYSEASER
jgi:hypothetical protein